MKKIFSLVLTALLMAFTMGINSNAMAAVLTAKTPILIQSDTSVSEDTHKTGDTVKFHVVNAVVDKDNNVIIPAGTPVYGKILKLEKKKPIGRPTELNISELQAKLANGMVINLKGGVYKRSESRMKRSIALSVLVIPFFLFMKGAAVTLTPETQVTVYPVVDYSL